MFNKLYFTALCVLLLAIYTVPLMASAQEVGGDRKIPVRLLSPLQFKEQVVSQAPSRKELESLYDATVSLGENEQNGVELTSEGAGCANQKSVVDCILENQERGLKPAQKTVHSCREYNDLKGRGWIAPTTVARSMESFFIETCGVLDALAFAAPATKSNFPELGFSEALESHYPSELLEVIFIGDNLCSETARFTECVNKLDGHTKYYRGQLHYEDEYHTAAFTPMLAADLNRDGVEDLVVNVGFYAKTGTFRGYSQIWIEFPDRDKDISLIVDQIGSAGREGL